MKISREEVYDLLRAVKIEEDPEEAEKMSKEISIFEKWVEPLLSVDTEGIEPAFYNFKGNNVQRDDEVVPCSDRTKLFKTAINYEDGFYRVPPIIE